MALGVMVHSRSLSGDKPSLEFKTTCDNGDGQELTTIRRTSSIDSAAMAWLSSLEHRRLS